MRENDIHDRRIGIGKHVKPRLEKEAKKRNEKGFLVQEVVIFYINE
jgi:hypothetical protein